MKVKLFQMPGGARGTESGRYYAVKSIKRGEELTIDYSKLDDEVNNLEM